MKQLATSHRSSHDVMADLVNWLVENSCVADTSPTGRSNVLHQAGDVVDSLRPRSPKETPRSNVRRLDANVCRRVTDAFVRNGAPDGLADVGSVESIADQICDLFSSLDSKALARDCIQGQKSEVRKLDMSPETALLVVAIAGAATILAFVVSARRGKPLTWQGKSLQVSSDFASLQRVRNAKGPEAELAQRVIDTALSPWDFTLKDGLSSLSAAEKRSLLRVLVQDDLHRESLVEVLPRAGVAFDGKEMQTGQPLPKDGVWVVMSDTAPEDAGFQYLGHVLVVARVTVCSADWWCLSAGYPDCPVGRAVSNQTAHYLGSSPEVARLWSARHGFNTFGDLRTEFDEVSLARWRREFSERLKEWYPPRSEHVPMVMGASGEMYDQSIMRAIGDVHVEQARVWRVVERDGEPQVGYGCPGAAPLLYAIVELEEVV